MSVLQGTLAVDCEGYREMSVSRHVLRHLTYRSPHRRKLNLDRSSQVYDVTKHVRWRREYKWFGKLGSGMPVGGQGWGVGGRQHPGQHIGKWRLATVDDMKSSCYACLKRDLAWRPNSQYKRKPPASKPMQPPPALAASWPASAHSSPLYDDVIQRQNTFLKESNVSSVSAATHARHESSSTQASSCEKSCDVEDSLEPLGHVVYDLDTYWTTSQSVEDSCGGYEGSSVEYGRLVLGATSQHICAAECEGGKRHKGALGGLFLEPLTLAPILTTNQETHQDLAMPSPNRPRDLVDRMEPKPGGGAGSSVGGDPAGGGGGWVSSRRAAGGGRGSSPVGGEGGDTMGVQQEALHGVAGMATTDLIPPHHMHTTQDKALDVNSNDKHLQVKLGAGGTRVQQEPNWDIDIDTLILEDEGGVSLTDTDDEDERDYMKNKAAKASYMQQDFVQADSEEEEGGGGNSLSTSITAWRELDQHTHHHGNKTSFPVTPGHHGNRPNTAGGDGDDTGVSGKDGVRRWGRTGDESPPLSARRGTDIAPHEPFPYLPRAASPARYAAGQGVHGQEEEEEDISPPGDEGAEGGGQSTGVLRIKRKHLRRRFMDDDHEHTRPQSGDVSTLRLQHMSPEKGRGVGPGGDPFYLHPGGSSTYSTVAERVIEKYRSRASSDSVAIMQKMTEHAGSFQKNFKEKVAERRRSMPQMPRKLEPLGFTSSLEDLSTAPPGLQVRRGRGKGPLTLSDKAPPTSPLTEPLISPKSISPLPSPRSDVFPSQRLPKMDSLSPQMSPKVMSESELPAWLVRGEASLSPSHLGAGARRASYHRVDSIHPPPASSSLMEPPQQHHRGRRKSDVYPLRPDSPSNL